MVKAKMPRRRLNEKTKRERTTYTGESKKKRRLREKTNPQHTVYARAKEEESSSGQCSTLNPNAKEFKPQEMQQEATTAAPP